MGRVIVSASRRTDIPRYYARWFGERRKAGFAEYRNVFGGKGRVSLRNEDLVGFLFWTRYAHPFRAHLRQLRSEGVPCVFQYTITGYGPPIEPHVVSRERAIDDFRRTSRELPDPSAIEWRYDPILLSERFPPAWHVENFGGIAEGLRGATRVVNTSIVEPYLKTVRRLSGEAVRFRRIDPQRHRTVSRRDPPVAQVGGAAVALLGTLAAIARDHDMVLRVCSNPEYAAFPPARCCGAEIFAPYGAAVAREVQGLPAAPSRSGCRCVRVHDIGMDNTCVAGCAYCYVVTSQARAIANFRRHDPTAPSLR